MIVSYLSIMVLETPGEDPEIPISAILSFALVWKYLCSPLFFVVLLLVLGHP